jgi:hypothetical protein
MTSSVLLRAQQLADELNAVEGLVAIVDPAHAAANLPCVLVAPPAIEWGRLDGGASVVTWRLLCLGPGLATLAAVDAMTELLELVSDVLPITRADPGSYQLGDQLVACYVATFTDDPATWPTT